LLIKTLHSYDLPAVVALELSLASVEYSEWVLSSCA
jgi:uncharacterized protein involved in tolerance to divalent cations